MKLAELMDPQELQTRINEGYVRVSTPTELGLRVYCYTDKTVIEENWDHVTRKCRGLVVGADTQIVAFCMSKFFNAAEHINGKPYAGPLPGNVGYRIYDKADGSMGTVFCYEGKWRAATKSGFNSPQAQWAQHWLDEHDLSMLPPDNTYVCEIIYPENRIVVDYRRMETLKLLAVIGPDGQERDIHLWGGAWEVSGGTVIRQFPSAKISALLFRSQRNQRIDGTPVTGTTAEGYVVRFDNGQRVKIKFSDYVKLHGVVTGLTERHVWELLREGRGLDELYAVLPDEYYRWATETARLLRKLFDDEAAALLDALLSTGIPSDPRDFTGYQDSRGGALSALYDAVSKYTWAVIRPAAVGPWKGDQ